MGYTYNMKKIIVTSLLISLLIPTSSAHAVKPLNTKANKASCKTIKQTYASVVMSKWSNGLANDEEALKEIESNINMLSKKQKATTGKIKVVIGDWIKSEQKTKDALTDKNIEVMATAMNLKISSITKFDKLCKSIEK
jgi:hypothetical protein